MGSRIGWMMVKFESNLFLLIVDFGSEGKEI